MRKCTSRTRLVLQSCDFRAGAAEVYFEYWTFATKLRFSSWRCGSVLPVLDLYYTVACSLRTRLLLQSCGFRAGAAEVYFAYLSLLQSCGFRAGDAEVYFAYLTCTAKLRLEMRKFTSRTRLVLQSCDSVLPILDLYYKVAIFELELRKCTSRTRLALHSCEF